MNLASNPLYSFKKNGGESGLERRDPLFTNGMPPVKSAQVGTWSLFGPQFIQPKHIKTWLVDWTPVKNISQWKHTWRNKLFVEHGFASCESWMLIRLFLIDELLGGPAAPAAPARVRRTRDQTSNKNNWGGSTNNTGWWLSHPSEKY